LDRHQVDHFADAVRAEEARHQHVAVGQVHLLVLGLVEAGDLEEASFLLVENRAKNAGRVEVRQAAPVDRTVHTHQRHRVQVANDAVGLDRLIDHFLTRLSPQREARRIPHRGSQQKTSMSLLAFDNHANGSYGYPAQTRLAPPMARRPSIRLTVVATTLCGSPVSSWFPLQASLQTVSLTSVLMSNRTERGSSATKSAQISARRCLDPFHDPRPDGRKRITTKEYPRRNMRQRQTTKTYVRRPR